MSGLVVFGEAGPEAVIPLSRLQGRHTAPMVLYANLIIDGRVVADGVRGELIRTGVMTGQPVLRGV